MNRREKYNQGYNMDMAEQCGVPNIVYDITTLDIFCRFVLSENRNINRMDLLNLQNLFEILDTSMYENESAQRVRFINDVISVKLNNGSVGRAVILNDIATNDGFSTENRININDYDELNNEEVEWAKNKISNTLKYCKLSGYVDRALMAFQEYKNNYDNNGEGLLVEVEELVRDLSNEFRRDRASDSNTLDFSLEPDEFANAVSTTYRQVTSNENKLRLGNKALNIITGGGLEASRSYVILGLPGEGKSATLLDMALQVRAYNSNYKCKDQTKRPCVVLLLMENTVNESIERIFSMCTNGGQMANFSEQQVFDILRNNGSLTLNSNNPVDLVIRYRQFGTADTNYLYEIYDELADQGKEVICVFQDYVKGIRSADRSVWGDTRLEYGMIVKEFGGFAKNKNIPVVTAHQINRVGICKVDDARAMGEHNIVRYLTRADIGDSNLILENCDYAFAIAYEYNDEDTEKYLGMHRLKSRNYIAPINGINSEFIYAQYSNRSIKLCEDENTIYNMYKYDLSPQLNTDMQSVEGYAQQQEAVVASMADLEPIGSRLLTPENMIVGASQVAKQIVFAPQPMIYNDYRPYRVMAEKVDNTKKRVMAVKVR